MTEFTPSESTESPPFPPADTVNEPEDVLDSPETPWHLWVVGIVALLWNAVGAYDYLMTQTQNEAYMSNFSAEQLDFFYNFPGWVTFFWAIAVWGSVLGSVLLLLKQKWAVEVFLGSLVAMVITAFHNFGLANGMEIMGVGGFIFTIVIFLVAVGLWIYSKKMRESDVIG